MNGRTGAKRLVLPITQLRRHADRLIQRPAVNENVTNPNVLAERFYSLASLRILLSDNAADITGLPGVTATAPLPLGAGAPAMATAARAPSRTRSTGLDERCEQPDAVRDRAGDRRLGHRRAGLRRARAGRTRRSSAATSRSRCRTRPASGRTSRSRS